jgi:hypothetical protein
MMQTMSGQHHAIGDDLGLAGGEAAKDSCALVERCRAIEVLGAHASLHELVADVDAVADAASESDGLAVLAIFEPVRDDVAD